MNIEDKITVPASRELIVEEMQRPEVLERTIPNCTDVEQTGEKTYRVVVSESISMISLEMEVELEIIEFDPPDSFTVRITGSALGNNTKVDGEQGMTLVENDDGESEVELALDIDVTGRLVSLGFRQLKGTMTKRIEQMADNICEEFSESENSEM